jgi:hypothetical protein
MKKVWEENESFNLKQGAAFAANAAGRAERELKRGAK